VYYSHLQAAENRMSLTIRATGDPAALAGAVRRIVWALDPALPVYAVSTMEQQIADSPAVFVRRYPLVLLAAFAAAAVALTVVGVYGVIAYTVAQRTREFAIRMALGARGKDVLAIVMRHGAAVTAAGVAAGGVVAALAARGLRSILYGVGAIDAATYALVAALLVSVALAASYVAARRAARVDPLVALKEE
jgi:putative ABC transport system permease protein